MAAGEARALAQALRSEVRRRLQLLAALAAAPVLDQPAADLRAVDRQARAVARLLGGPVSMIDATFAQLLDTDRPFGTPLAALGDEAVALAALESGDVAVGEDAPDAARAITLAVPVRRGERTLAVLVSGIGRADLERLVTEGAATAAGMELALVAPGERLAAATAGLAGAGADRLQPGVTPDLALAAVAVEVVPGWRAVALRSGALTLPERRRGQVPPALAALAGAAGLGGIVLAAGLLRRRTGQGRIGQGQTGQGQTGQGALGAPGRAAGPAAKGAAEEGAAARIGEAAALHSLSGIRRLHDTIPVGLALLDRAQCFQSVNAKFAGIAGLPVAELICRQPREVLPPAIAETLEGAHRRVFATDQPVLDLPLAAEAPGAVRNERHFLVSCHPAHDAEQRVIGVSVVMQDVTERVRAEGTRELLVRELNHRVKNTLATVQSIVAATLRQARGVPAGLNEHLAARLLALARAHDLLTAHAWQTTDLAEVVRASLAPWLHSFPARILLDGPPGVPLRPAQAQAVVLALHELATNAVKYGALSSAEGRVALHWEAPAEGPACLRWTEAGGPPVEAPPPGKRGFGTRLLERALASDLGAGSMVVLDFARDGLRAAITFRGEGGGRPLPCPPEVLPPAPPPILRPVLRPVVPAA